MRGFAKRAAPHGWMAVAALFFVVGARGGEPLPVKVFFDRPAISEATISPTGRYVALAAANRDGHDQLVVIDTQTLQPFVAAASPTLDVSRVRWVNDKRLVYNLGNPERDISVIRGSDGLLAVDRDGREHRQLGSGRIQGTTWLQDSDDVFVTRAEFGPGFEVRYVNAFVLDTRTGRHTQLETHRKTLSFLMGPDNVPRVIVTRLEGSKAQIEYRESESSEWVKLADFDFMTGDGGFNPLGFTDDGKLLVAAEPRGTANEALYTYDLKSRTLSPEPLLDAKGFDVKPLLIRSKNTIVGLRFETDAVGTVWFDPEMKKAQAKVDALLPGTANVIVLPVRAEVPIVLVAAFSDVDPGEYFLFDLKTEKLTALGKTQPEVNPRQMAHKDFARYNARDGLEIPAWVTMPKDGKKGPHPMVVMVHGGPYVRGGHWRWNAETQFLASRGYVVLEPEFRGSTGFGQKLFKAGWKQWGLAMQNDIADGVRWAIDKGIADPKRVCIAGASYGGYATLMGLANDPDLYRCGVDWVGVTDIDLLYSIHWSDTSEIFKTYGMPVLVADREKDAQQIKATSPIQQAARIKAPLLLAYGGSDPRVPIEHGLAFRDAVKKTNPDVEWIEYTSEAHGWAQLKTNIDFWTRVEKFLARNIGDGAKQ